MKFKHGHVVISVICLNGILNDCNILRSTVKGRDPATFVSVHFRLVFGRRKILVVCMSCKTKKYV